MSWLLDLNWVGLLTLLIGAAVSVMFFRLYSRHDQILIDFRLLRSKYENITPRDLNHKSRLTIRFLFALGVGLLVAGVSWALIPATWVVGGMGFLIFDPTLNMDRGRDIFYTSDGNNWDAFIRRLTGRDTEAGRVSAYVEAALVVIMLVLYLWLTHP